MESISGILDVIAADAHAEAREIVQSGKVTGGRIRHDYEEKARIAKENIVEEALKRAEKIRQHSISKAALEAANINLFARRCIIHDVFGKAEEMLIALDKNKKKAFYEKLIAKYRTGSEIVVQLNEKDTARIGEKLKVKGINIILDEKTGNFSGGLIIKEHDSEVDCTFKAITENAKREMESEIADILFT